MPSIDKFIAGMIAHGQKQRAAIEAGYSERSAHVTASRLLKTAKVSEALKNHATKILEEAEATAAETLREITRLAMSNKQDYYDEIGLPKPLKSLTRAQAAAIQSIDILKTNTRSGDGATEQLIRYKLHDKNKALEMLAKHFALLTERIEHAGGMVLTWKDTEE